MPIKIFVAFLFGYFPENNTRYDMIHCGSDSQWSAQCVLEVSEPGVFLKL